MTDGITVLSKESAWNQVNKIFKYDYEKDEASSKTAGYPIFRATAEGHFNNWISDLGCTLEVNTEDGKTVRINIDHPAESQRSNHSSYKIFITDSAEAAHLIGRGLREATPWSRQGGQTLSIESGQVLQDCRIPALYHGSDKFYVLIEYRNGTDWNHPEYALVNC